jgi:hypothetical protein
MNNTITHVLPTSGKFMPACRYADSVADSALARIFKMQFFLQICRF